MALGPEITHLTQPFSLPIFQEILSQFWLFKIANINKYGVTSFVEWSRTELCTTAFGRNVWYENLIPCCNWLNSGICDSANWISQPVDVSRTFSIYHNSWFRSYIFKVLRQNSCNINIFPFFGLCGTWKRISPNFLNWKLQNSCDNNSLCWRKWPRIFEAINWANKNATCLAKSCITHL